VVAKRINGVEVVRAGATHMKCIADPARWVATASAITLSRECNDTRDQDGNRHPGPLFPAVDHYPMAKPPGAIVVAHTCWTHILHLAQYYTLFILKRE